MDDLISRQAAIELIERMKPYHQDADDIAEMIANMPSAQPERKKGKWIKKMRIIETDKYASYTPEWYCSCCGGGYKPYIAELISFCPDCGAEMREEKTDGHS